MENSSSFVGMQNFFSNALGSFSSLKTYFGTQPPSIPSSPASSGKKKCKLCSNLINDIKKCQPLPCSHTFCLSCFKALKHQETVDNSEISCPICEQKSNSEESVIEVNTNEEDQFLSKSFVEVPLAQQNNKENLEQSQGASLRSSYEDGFVVIEEPIPHILPSKYVPFSIKQEHCRAKTEQWLKNIWFVPYDLDEKTEIQEFQPFYVPFYSFDITTKTSYCAKIQPTTKGTTDWKQVEGTISSDFEDLVVCGSCALKPKYETQLLKLVEEPGSFTLETKKIPPPGAPPYSSDVNLPETVLPVEIDFTEAYKANAKLKIYQKEKEKIEEQIHHKYNSTVKDITLNIEFLKFHFSLTLLPIFLGSFQYLENSYEVVISGNRGNIQGIYPTGGGRFLKYCRDIYQSVTKEDKSV